VNYPFNADYKLALLICRMWKCSLWGK